MNVLTLGLIVLGIGFVYGGWLIWYVTKDEIRPKGGRRKWQK